MLNVLIDWVDNCQLPLKAKNIRVIEKAIKECVTKFTLVDWKKETLICFYVSLICQEQWNSTKYERSKY